MATMIPSAISDAYMRTAGERKLYGILKKVLPDDCLVRFEMILGQRDSRPDFIVIDPNRGILIIEVKDYSVDKIARASKEQIEVRGMGGNPAPIPLPNPQLKCEFYLMDARQQLVSMPALHDDRGHLVIAVDYFIAMTNITENDFKKAGLHEVIDPEHVLFKESLHEHGGFFLQHYEKQLKELEQPLSNDQQSEISRALFPDLVLPRVSESGFIPAHKSVIHKDKNALSYYALSTEQEDIAKSLGEGPRLLRGIAGTGKTLIMLYRAKLTAANNEDARILVLCWNTALANYMRQAYDNIAIAAKDNVTIKHFSDFVQNDLRIRVNNDDWDREDFTRLLFAQTIVESYKFDAVYIDEAQDFRREWIEFIFKRLIKGEPKERNMIVAADDAQLIYPSRGFSWSSLNLDGANFTGRSKILKTIYRNAARVWTFSAFLLEDKAAYVKEGNNKLKVL